MKKIYTLITAALFLVAVKHVQAQSSGSSFSVQHDTMYISTAGFANMINGVNNTSGGSLPIQWKVLSSNFPTDWIPGVGICDNSNCFTGTGLWPSGTTPSSGMWPSGNTYAATYGSAGLGDFHVNLDLTFASTLGTYYLRVRLNNASVPTDTAVQTYIISKIPAAVPVIKSENEVSIYPNPAINELNVVYEAGADVKTIAIYNIIGKVMAVYRPTDNAGAKLTLENIPSGIYFVRLMNTHGDILVTKKFTKQ